MGFCQQFHQIHLTSYKNWTKQTFAWVKCRFMLITLRKTSGRPRALPSASTLNTIDKVKQSLPGWRLQISSENIGGSKWWASSFSLGIKDAPRCAHSRSNTEPLGINAVISVKCRPICRQKIIFVLKLNQDLKFLYFNISSAHKQ